MRTLLGLFLIAHGLIHASYLVPTPAGAKEWPFTLGRSSLLSGLNDAALRPLGLVLAVAAVTAFLGAGLGLLGVPLLHALWPTLAVAGAAASLLLLVLFWHAWLVVGVVISAAVVFAILVARWPEAVLGAS